MSTTFDQPFILEHRASYPSTYTCLELEPQGWLALSPEENSLEQLSKNVQAWAHWKKSSRELTKTSANEELIGVAVRGSFIVGAGTIGVDEDVVASNAGWNKLAREDLRRRSPEKNMTLHAWNYHACHHVFNLVFIFSLKMTFSCFNFIEDCSLYLFQFSFDFDNFACQYTFSMCDIELIVQLGMSVVYVNLAQCSYRNPEP